MAQSKTLTTQNDFQDVAGRIAMGAAAISLITGIVAIGAAALSDQRTRNKMANDARSVVNNFRRVVEYLRREGRDTYNSLKEV